MWPLRQAGLVYTYAGQLLKILPLPLVISDDEKRVITEELFFSCLHVGDYESAERLLARDLVDATVPEPLPFKQKGDGDGDGESDEDEGLVDIYENEDLDLAAPLPFTTSLRCLLDEYRLRSGTLDEGRQDQTAGAEQEEDEVRDVEMAKRLKAGRGLLRRRAARSAARVEFTANSQKAPAVHSLRARQAHVAKAKSLGGMLVSRWIVVLLCVRSGSRMVVMLVGMVVVVCVCVCVCVLGL